jgi:hypothetical protein
MPRALLAEVISGFPLQRSRLFTDALEQSRA